MNNAMNEDQLENMLRGLAPAAASLALRQRVDEELKLDMSWLGTRPKPQRKSHWITSAGWAAMGAAAAIAVMSYLPQHAGTNANAVAAAPVAVPGTILREWDEAEESGIHHGRGRLDEKRALVISRELQTWVDPRYAAETSLEIPSKQQLLLPISYR